MNMNNAFKELFSSIQAEEALKERTKAFLAEKTQGYTSARTGIGRVPIYAIREAQHLVVSHQAVAGVLE